MVKIDVEGLESELSEGVDLSKTPPYNDPHCKHEFIEEVEDGMEGVKAFRCKQCMVGWLVRDPLVKDKIKEKEK